MEAAENVCGTRRLPAAGGGDRAWPTPSHLVAQLLIGAWMTLCASAATMAQVAVQSKCPWVERGPVDAEIPMWRPPSDAPHGMHQFGRSTRVVLPAGVTTVETEVWGAGGGGGGGSPETFTEGGAGGGGGASGAYVRLVLSVESETAYVVVVGGGGAGGLISRAGGDGGDSAICREQAALAVAPGGGGGRGAITNEVGGKGGRPTGDGGPAAAASGSRREGSSGSDGLRPLFEYRGPGGRGGLASQGTKIPDGSFGGDGGAGEMRPLPAKPGAAGGGGAVLIRW